MRKIMLGAILGISFCLPQIVFASAFEPQGTLLKFQTDPRVYLVTDNTGTIELIQNEEEFVKRGFSFNNIKTLSDALISNYNVRVVSDIPEEVSEAPSIPQTTEEIVFVEDGGRTVIDINSNKKWSLASISKLMTALVLDDLKLDWNKAVIQNKSDEVGGARLRVSVGSKYRRIDLLHASLMGSANNSTHALARTSGLTTPQFVARMNAKAKALGMTETHFVEPTGLSSSNVSTAHDIALLIKAAQKVPRIATIGKKSSYTLKSIAKKPKSHTITTTNKLLLAGEDVSLGKTGFIDESRYNFTVVGKAPTGEQRVVVVLNASSSANSFKLAKEYIHLEK